MGLDCSHNAWHGAYSAFMRWREKVAELAGIPLWLMENFYEPPKWCHTRPPRPVDRETAEAYEIPVEMYCAIDSSIVDSHKYYSVFRILPLKWENMRPDPLHVLLNHSDCDGSIASADCGPLAKRLEEILDLMPDKDAGGHIGNWREKTKTFIDGLLLAASSGEDLEFH